MKIGLVSAHAFLKEGGVKNHIIFLKKYLEKEGHSVKILLPEDFGKIFFLPANASEGTISFSSKKKIFFVLEKEKFDILHFHNFSLFFPYFVLKEAKKMKKKPVLILTFHASLDASFFFKKTSPLIKIFEKKFLPFLDGIIFTSKTTASQIQTKIPSRIIPNGISLEKFSPEGEKIKKFPSKKFIFFVGRLEKRKGVFYLLKIFSLLKKDFPFLHLVVGGEGPLKRKLQKYALHLGLKKVHFVGKISDEELPKYYRSCLFCLFPSLYGEGFGIVLLEAMASGTLPFGFKNRGYLEVLKGKERYLLAEPKDTKTLVQKIKRFLLDKDLRISLENWAKKEVKKYSWEKVVKNILNFYKKLL